MYVFGFNYFCHFLDFLPLLATKKLIFFVGSKGKKKKLTKIAKIEEIKIHIFCETEIFGENITYNDIKSDQKPKLYRLFRQCIFGNIFLRLMRGFFG